MFQWNGTELNPLSSGSWIAHALVIQPFDLNIIKNDKGVFVELFPFVYAFGAEISKFADDNITNIDTVLTSELLSVYNINFEIFDSYYGVDTGISFDEVFTEYMNNPDNQFEWENWGEKANAGVARFWDVIVDDYDGIFNYAYDSYESDMLYNEALIAILRTFYRI